MVRKYIRRDWTDHERTTEYLSDEDEYIKLEIFSFDHELTQTFVPELGTLTGENVNKTYWKSWACFKSKDMINPMEFTLNYKVKTPGLYRIDILYEKNDKIYSDNDYNTSKDLTGWYDIYLKNSKSEHKARVNKVKKTSIVYPKGKIDAKTKKQTEKALLKSGKITKNDLKNNEYLEKLINSVNENVLAVPKNSNSLRFEGENNITKRKTIFKQLNEGDWKFEIGVPHNCYMLGAIVRKVIRFWGTNNDEAGSNLQFTEAKYTHSDMVKPAELEVTVGGDDAFDCEYAPSGLYMDYMDEVNVYVKNNEGNIERVFGGYISTPISDKDKLEISIHCADRLKDGENKYILDQLLLQNGDTSKSEYPSARSFDKYSEVIKYLCRLYEITLNYNIENHHVKREIYNEGFTISFGKKKNIKKIPVTNGKVTINKNSVTLRNNPSGKKKQVWTLYETKKPQNISNYENLHIHYGLGNPKTSNKTKETTSVDVASSTAGSQKFGKCGQSQDKKYVMGIGKVSAGKRGNLKTNQLYKSLFINKCPHCGKPTLRWDSARSDTKCIFTQRWKGSKKNWDGGIPETEITCNNCDSDYDAVTGWEKDGRYSSRLKKVGTTVKSSKSEQNKLHKGNMMAIPGGKISINSKDIFKAIKNSVKGFTYSTGTGSTASYLEKHGVGDCWAWSDKISKELKKYKVNHKIVEYKSSGSNKHRSVLYQNKNGEYVDFPYQKYNFPNGTHNSRGSKHGHPVYKYKSGGRINQAVTKGSTSKTETTEMTTTKGYDKDKPIQGYFDICYSLSPSIKSKKYHAYVNFTQIANSDYAMSGLKPVWVNNTSKKITLSKFISKIRDYQGENKQIYLRSISFIAPKIEKTATTTDSDSVTDTSTDWYTYDKSTKDNSSCKIKLFDISFNNESGTQPSDLSACGKSVNELMKSIVEDGNYIIDMEYGEHRCDDKINFRVDNSINPVFTATEGNNNNILDWGNIGYDPANGLFNMSMCVFKNTVTKKYSYVDSRFPESILKYQEQCTLLTENELIGAKEAYWNARHNDKFNPEQEHTYTITVKGFPDVHLKDYVEVVANAKNLTALKECESVTMTYSNTTKPVIQTELGLGELAPDLQVAKNVRLLRKNAKSKTTSFSSTATPIIDTNIYEWD